MSVALVAVVGLSLSAGVGLGYAIIFGILDLFDRSRHAFKPAPVRVLSSTAGHN